MSLGSTPETTAPQPGAQTDTEADGQALQNALKAMLHSVQEVIDYSRYYAELHWDQVKLSAVGYALLAMVGVVAGIALVAMLCVASVVFVLGLCYSLSHWLFEGNAAFGLLLGGGIVLAVLLGGVGAVYLYVQSKFKASLSKKYEAKKREQRARYGHDVEQRAAVAA